MADDLIKILYANKPRVLIEQLCRHPHTFNLEFLAKYAKSIGLKVTPSMPKHEVCFLIQQHTGRDTIFASLGRAWTQTFQSLVAFASSSAYLKHMMNSVLNDMHDPVFQYLFLTDAPKLEEVRAISSVAYAQREGAAYLLLQQLATKYTAFVSTLNMIVYDVQWSAGRIFTGTNPPYISASPAQKELAAALAHRLQAALNNITATYNKLHSDPATQKWLQMLREDKRHEETKQIQLTAISTFAQAMAKKKSSSSRRRTR